MNLFSRWFSTPLEKQYERIVGDEAGKRELSRDDVLKLIERGLPASSDAEQPSDGRRPESWGDPAADLYPATACLDAAELQQLASGSGLETSRAEHLRQCGLCQALEAKSHLFRDQLEEVAEKLARSSAASSEGQLDSRLSPGGEESAPLQYEWLNQSAVDQRSEQDSHLEVLTLPAEESSSAEARWLPGLVPACVMFILIGAIVVSDWSTPRMIFEVDYHGVLASSPGVPNLSGRELAIQPLMEDSDGAWHLWWPSEQAKTDDLTDIGLDKPVRIAGYLEIFGSGDASLTVRQIEQAEDMPDEPNMVVRKLAIGDRLESLKNSLKFDL